MLEIWQIKLCDKWSSVDWMNISVTSATDCNFFYFNVLTLSKPQTLIIYDKTLAVAHTQVLQIWLINLQETLNCLYSSRIPKRIFINLIRNSSCLVIIQAGPFLFRFDWMNLLIGFLVDFASHHFSSTFWEIKSHNVNNLGIPV